MEVRGRLHFPTALHLRHYDFHCFNDSHFGHVAIGKIAASGGN